MTARKSGPGRESATSPMSPGSEPGRSRTFGTAVSATFSSPAHTSSHSLRS